MGALVLYTFDVVSCFIVFFWGKPITTKSKTGFKVENWNAKLLHN